MTRSRRGGMETLELALGFEPRGREKEGGFLGPSKGSPRAQPKDFTFGILSRPFLAEADETLSKAILILRIKHLRADNNDLEGKVANAGTSMSGCARLSVSRINAIRSEFPAGERSTRANGKQRHRGTASRREELVFWKGRHPPRTYIRRGPARRIQYAHARQ